MGEEKKEIEVNIETDRLESPLKKKKPLGILILGGINLFVFGIGSCIFFLFILQNISSPDNRMLYREPSRSVSSSTGRLLFEEAQEYLPEQNLSLSQFKTAIILQITVSLIFFISGTGLFLKKEWARKLTLYFAFFMAILAALSALVNFSLVKGAILQIIYPGILIFYFTRKDIENYFIPPKGGSEGGGRE